MTNYNEHISKKLAKKLLDYGYPLGNQPTYGEVFDWFSQKGIVITLEPFHTFALKGQIGYTWKINYIDPELGLVLRSEDDEYKPYDGYGGSFKLTANAAIESAMRIGDKSIEVKYIEVNIDEL